MLLWQRKKHKFAYCFKLVGFICMLHMFMLSLLLVQHRGGGEHWHIIADHNYDLSADVLVVPFKKVIPQPKTQPTPQQVPEQKETAPTKETVLAEPSQKKPAPQIEPMQPIEKKEAPVEQPKAEKEKIEPKQEELKPQEKEVSKPQQEQQKEIKAQPAKAAQPSVTKPQNSKVTAPQKTVVPKKEIGTEQLRALRVQQALAEQVALHWHPPAGFSDELSVTLGIQLGYDGSVTEIEMIQSSEVLVFDIHARSAVYAMRFPRACWGQQITITFK